MTVAFESPPIKTIGDLLDRLGGIPADRVRFRPAPGNATEQDVIQSRERSGAHCELIDGTLVEKAMGLYESIIAGIIVRLLGEFVAKNRLGVVAISDGMYRVTPDQIRMPDASFVSWNRLSTDFQNQAAADLAPDLAVEVLSSGNTAREMQRKRREFFAGGTRLMWIVDPKARTVTVHTDAESDPVILGEDQTVDGGAVLPGFSFSIRRLFAEAQHPQN